MPTRGAQLTILLAIVALHACSDDASQPRPEVRGDRDATTQTPSSQPSGPTALVADCAEFTKADAAAFLAVAPETLSDHSRDETPKLRLCSYAQSAAPFAIVSFSLSARDSVDRAVRSMASEREMMGDANAAIARSTSGAPEQAPADPLAGVGDEAFWSPLNGALMMRVDRVIVQITKPEQQDRQRELALQIAAKLRGAAAQVKRPTNDVMQASVPLVEGLTLVTAVHIDGLCDCESVKQITAADAESVHVSYAADVPTDAIEDLLGQSREKGAVRQVRGERTVLREDLETAREYMHLFGQGIPKRLPGATALGVSTAVLRDLHAQGESPLSMPAGAVGAGLAGLIGAFGGEDFASVKEVGELAELDMMSGSLERAETEEPLLFPVLVNGEMRALPVVHARGRIGDLDGDFYILDDPANPLALKFTLGEDRLHVVKIEYPRSQQNSSIAASSLACALSGEARRAEIHGVHFDFASAAIRPQSEPVLAEIAKALRQQPRWTLSIEGHTDEVGAPAYNSQLSHTRASAVRQSLIEHGIGAERLAAAGYGAERPKASNETLDGRARNRRVELVRTDSTGGSSVCEAA